MGTYPLSVSVAVKALVERRIAVSKKRKKKRLQMQARPRPTVDISVELASDNPQALRMLVIARSIAEYGTYPCPECGTPVELVNRDANTSEMHFRCPNPECEYHATWGGIGVF